MNQPVEALGNACKLCTHTFEGGHICASPALRGEHFCYYHHPTRRPVRTLESCQRHARRARRIARQSFTLDGPTTPPELQLALNQVLHRVAANRLDLRRAGLILQALQIASQNLNRGG